MVKLMKVQYLYIMVLLLVLALHMTGWLKLLRNGWGAHYLNHKAVYEATKRLLELNDDEAIVTAHVGGGASFARHDKNRIVNVLNAFGCLPSANRAGNLPIYDAIEEIREGHVSITEVESLFFSKGGLYSTACR